MQRQELEALVRQASDGVIHFTPQMFDDYMTGKRRPYAMIMFCTATHLLDKPQLNLRGLRKEFGLLATEVKKSGKPGVFFVDLEFKESKAIFHRLGVQSLPWIVHVNPNLPVGADGVIKFKQDEVMRHDDYGHHHWKAEDMAAFLRDKTGINIEKVDRPSFMRSGWFPVVFLAAVLTLGAVAYNLYYAEFMKNLVLWTMGVLFVYWFSVSGGMHNIIRGVPLYYPDQEGKIKVFLPSNQGQLGAEGFIMGFMYLLFGLSVASLTFAVPKLAEPSHRRTASYVIIVFAGLVFKQIVNNYTWKTGYRWRLYF